MYIFTLWYPITTIPPSDFMGSNSHGYWGGKFMHRAGFDLAIYHMRRPHVIVEQVHLLNQCATLQPYAVILLYLICAKAFCKNFNKWPKIG